MTSVTTPTAEQLLEAFRAVVAADPHGTFIGYAVNYAKVGLDRSRMESAAAVKGTTYENALRRQCDYILSNAAAWKGETAREVKKVLRAGSDGEEI